jgi:molecular chaperone HscB
MIDYFELVGIPRRFGVDVGELRRKYLQLSREFHPDYHTLAGEEAIRKMEEQSAQLNLAWQKLSDERLRLEYLIQLEGIALEEQVLPGEFLMEMMDLNERIEEDGRTEAIVESIQTGRKDCWDSAVQSAQEYDLAQDLESRRNVLQKASVYLLSLKYYDRLREGFS